MIVALAYLAGLLTLPALAAVIFGGVHLAEHAEPRAAWRWLWHRPMSPAWMYFARLAGKRRAWEHFDMFPEKCGEWADQERAHARGARWAGRWPVVLWPGRWLATAQTALGLR